MEPKHEIRGLDYMVPIRMVGMAWFAVAAIYFLPHNWWGVGLDVIFGIFLLIQIIASFSDEWEDYANLGAFLIMNTVYLAVLLWLHQITWLSYTAGFLIALAFTTQFSHIAKSNK